MSEWIMISQLSRCKSYITLCTSRYYLTKPFVKILCQKLIFYHTCIILIEFSSNPMYVHVHYHLLQDTFAATFPFRSYVHYVATFHNKQG